jgi:hypothetical protein
LFSSRRFLTIIKRLVARNGAASATDQKASPFSSNPDNSEIFKEEGSALMNFSLIVLSFFLTE